MDPIQKDTKTTSGKTPNLFFREPARLSPRKVADSDGIQECPVCWEKIESDFAALGCSHYICNKCCKKLINPTCPLCRQPIPSKTECLLPPISPIQQQREWIRRHPRRRRRRRGPRLSSMNRQSALPESRQSALPESRQSSDEAHLTPDQKKSSAKKVRWSDKKYQKKKTKRHNNYFNNYHR